MKNIHRSGWIGACLVAWLLQSTTLLAESAGGDNAHSVIANIALCLVAAGLLGLLMKLLKQPLILGYLLAGVAIGPLGLQLITDHSEIITLAEIGLILLLFMIGLEIDLKKMLSAGKLVLLPGLIQFPLTLILAFFLFKWIGLAALTPALAGYGLFYIAVAVSLSSTMIVVKLLYEKFEIDTLPGRITIGILVFQDIWAILVLAVQPSLSNPELTQILKTLAAGVALIAAALLASKYLLPATFKRVAKVPELLLVLALSWCFLVGLVAASRWISLSMEMGALIAGVALATFPYNLEVLSKVTSIRDFFITLFFVALGMQIPMPTSQVILIAAVIAIALLGLRFVGVFAPLFMLRAGHRAALLPTLNLAQSSEFSLVILTSGVGLGHIAPEALTYIIWVFAILAVLSTYLISYNHEIQSALSRLLIRLGLRDLSAENLERTSAHDRPIVLLGFFRNANALIDEIAEKHPDLCDQISVVDFNPLVKSKLEKLGIHCIYGDISHIETLHHAEIEGARLVICSIPDVFLKGTNNHKLHQTVRKLCPNAQIIVTADSQSKAVAYYEKGADYVLQPSQLAGVDLMGAVLAAVQGSLEPLRTRALEHFRHHQDIVD